MMPRHIDVPCARTPIEGVALVLLALSACTEGMREPAQRTSVDTLSQVVVVTNGRRGQWSAHERWRVRKEFQIGSGDVAAGQDEMLFTNVLTGVTLGPTGQICVLEFSTDELTCMDGDGSNPRRVARSGPGPGELEFPAGMGWDPQDRLWIAGAEGRYTVLDSAGELIKTVPRPIFGLARRQYPLVWEEGGTFIDEGFSEASLRLLRIDTDGHVVDSLATFPTSLPRPSMIILPSQEAYRFVVSHYLPVTKWAIGNDGTVWVTWTNELRLYNIDIETGDTLRIVNTTHRRGAQKLTREDNERIREGLVEVGLDRSAVDVARPVVESMHLTDDGFVLVQIVTEVGEDSNVFDVFSPEGIFMGTITMPFRLPEVSRADIVGDTIVGISLGEFDVPYVVRATITRPGREMPE